MASTAVTMDDLLAKQDVQPIQAGDSISGKVISVKKHEVWIDMGVYGIGIVPRRELANSSMLESGSDITASVLETETDEGHALLSLRRAVKDKGWEAVQKIYEDSQTVEVSPYDANRGGLLVELEGLRGFLPVSQLSPNNYPRVSSSDKDEILQKLHGIVGRPLRLRIIDVNRKDNKLIFSEKEALKEDIAKRFASLTVGDIVKGMVTGVIDFGAFVNVDGIEGLVHISEISWERIEDPRSHIKLGDQVDVKIIAVDKERLSLSIKQND